MGARRRVTRALCDGSGRAASNKSAPIAGTLKTRGDLLVSNFLEVCF